MTAADDRAAMVALLKIGRRPWVEYAELVETHGSAIEALGQELAAETAQGVQTSLIEPDAPTADELTLAAKADIERRDYQGMRLVTVLDPEYPPNLRAVHDRPPMLFISGRLTARDANAVAVVGAREASRSGLTLATAIAQHLVDKDFTVVSGLAAGIDTAAHTATLAATGRTVAVIGTGLARFYPPQNAVLQRDIARRCAVVSQFWPDAPPTRRSFPMRNAVMSGIALATVVVEASHTSGARMQARLALAQGRPVFISRALVGTQPWARQFATRPGTHVVDDPYEITTVLERLISPGSLVG